MSFLNHYQLFAQANKGFNAFRIEIICFSNIRIQGHF